MRKRRRIKGFLGGLAEIIYIIFLPLIILGEITKVVNYMARPANGRYGTRSIERRKKGRRRKRRF